MPSAGILADAISSPSMANYRSSLLREIVTIWTIMGLLGIVIGIAQSTIVNRPGNRTARDSLIFWATILCLFLVYGFTSYLWSKACFEPKVLFQDSNVQRDGFRLAKVRSGSQWIFGKRKPKMEADIEIGPFGDLNSQRANLQELDGSSTQVASSNQQRFCYSALSDTDVRLLQIEDSNDANDAINAKMIQLPLNSARERGYVAVSYTWGKEHSTSGLMVNDQYLSIRPNLEKVLRALRSASCCLLWVDAICINQEDLQERSAQVLRMRQIYAGAQRTVVVIDTPEKEARDLLNVLASIQPSLAASNQDGEVQSLIQDRKMQSKLMAYCQQAYWKRIWIVQEFAIGYRIELLIGTSLVSASSLEMVLGILQSQSSGTDNWWTQAQAIFNIRQWQQENRPIPLLKMLQETGSALCERRHDRVFGVLGLVSDAADFLLEPNYANSLSNLAVTMTRSYIERQSIEIIIMAQHMFPSNFQHVPSWCVGFFWFDQYTLDDRSATQALRHRRSKQSNTSEQTPKNWTATGTSSATCTFRSTALISSARRIGTIKSLGSAWTDAADAPFPVQDEEWARAQKESTDGRDLGTFMVDAMLEVEYEYKWFSKHLLLWSITEFLEKYLFVKAFSPKYGDYNNNNPEKRLQRWVCANRGFVACGDRLDEHAKRLGMMPFRCALMPFWYLIEGSSIFWTGFVEMPKKDMRMMCLEDNQYGIGWAAKGAELQDEIFLLPGCSVPLILRRVEGNEQYRLVGDAIVIGAMKNEVWGKTRPADLVEIEIV